MSKLCATKDFGRKSEVLERDNKASERLLKRGRPSRTPTCPKCMTKMWRKHKGGRYVCANASCKAYLKVMKENRSEKR